MPDAGMLLVDTELQILRRPAALADFLHLQELHIGDVTDALKSDWILKVSCVVRGVASMQHSLQNRNVRMKQTKPAHHTAM